MVTWRRPLGETGRVTPALGLGTGPLGDPSLDEGAAHALLDAAVALGVDLIDTAPSYGEAEARIGRWIAERGGEGITLATKGGYGPFDAAGIEDWTGAAVTASIDAALRRLQVEHVHIFYLHSCPAEILAREDVIRALEAAAAAGKIGHAGYSGEGDALARAITLPIFEVIETSVSVVDQRSMNTLIPAAGGRGVVAKRALGNAFWRHMAGAPEAPDVAEYWRRGRALALRPEPLSWPELMIRFSAYAPGVHTCLVGTGRPHHLQAAVDAVAEGPLPGDLQALIQGRYLSVGRGWPGLI